MAPQCTDDGAEFAAKPLAVCAASQVIVDLRAFSEVNTMLCCPAGTITPRRGVVPRLRPSSVMRELGIVLMLSEHVPPALAPGD